LVHADPMYVPLLHPPRSFVFTGCESKVPDLNAADDAVFSLAPTAEMGDFANLPTQADFASQVSSQCVGTSTWTYPAVPQNVLDPWTMPGPRMFLSCICHDPSYSLDANESKALFDANPAVSKPQLVGHPHWTGVAPFAAYSVAATPEVTANTSD
jgi:hypothetical protein